MPSSWMNVTRSLNAQFSGGINGRGGQKIKKEVKKWVEEGSVDKRCEKNLYPKQ
jgi:hypothetical protein